ncbi:hypothetical protein [Kitasatospora sp. NPDC059327]|uniref:hypothetical protein n=1 Tax=Kitasatospora sp. NPDC059327 TaxID=3346803 RepID=UPI0036965B95
MFQLLPGKGVILPRRAGVLTFGMTERTAQWAVATLADVRKSWVCQAGWAFTARYDGVDLLVYGDCADRAGRSERDRHGLAAVVLDRCRYTLTGPSAVPVVLDGVDVFGYPATEVLDVLAPADHPGLRVHDGALSSYLSQVSVSGPPFDARPRSGT